MFLCGSKPWGAIVATVAATTHFWTMNIFRSCGVETACSRVGWGRLWATTLYSWGWYDRNSASTKLISFTRSDNQFMAFCCFELAAFWQDSFWRGARKAPCAIKSISTWFSEVHRSSFRVLAQLVAGRFESIWGSWKIADGFAACKVRWKKWLLAKWLIFPMVSNLFL